MAASDVLISLFALFIKQSNASPHPAMAQKSYVEEIGEMILLEELKMRKTRCVCFTVSFIMWGYIDAAPSQKFTQSEIVIDNEMWKFILQV